MPLLLLTAISNLDFNFCVLGFDNLQPTSSARVHKSSQEIFNKDSIARRQDCRAIESGRV